MIKIFSVFKEQLYFLILISYLSCCTVSSLKAETVSLAHLCILCRKSTMVSLIIIGWMNGFIIREGSLRNLFLPLPALWQTLSLLR